MSVFNEEIKPLIENELVAAISHFQQEVNQLRSSRPSPALVENLMVECYRNKLPLKQLAAISIVMPNSIIIEPWDKTVVSSIVQALSSSDLNMAPVVDKDKVRLNLPPLSEERRNQLIKLLYEDAEQARVRIRQSRDRTSKKIDLLFREKEISEDDRYRFKEELQKLIDEFSKKIKTIIEQKENELKS